MKERSYTTKCSTKTRPAICAAFLLLALVLSTNASAENLSSYESGIQSISRITITVESSGFVKVTEELQVNNTIAKILLPGNVRDLAIKDSKGNVLSYDIDSVDGRQLVTFYLKAPEERRISLEYLTLDLTGKEGSKWTFRFSTTAVPGMTIVGVDFPAGSEILDLRPTEILRSPKNLTTQMLLYPQEKDFYFEFDYRTEHAAEGQDIMPYVLGILVVLILASAVTYALGRRRGAKKAKEAEEQQTEEKPPEEDATHMGEPIAVQEVSLGIEVNGRKINPSVLNMLEENERKIVEVIEHAQEEITQAYIYKTTGIPKATLSDIMKRLEKRNIIERKKEGRINWIKIQDWVFEK